MKSTRNKETLNKYFKRKKLKIQIFELNLNYFNSIFIIHLQILALVTKQIKIYKPNFLSALNT